MNFTEVFLRFASQKPEFREAVDLVQQNSEGNVWLVGGYVCRGIIQELYSIPMGDYDFDFVVEMEKEIVLPESWKKKVNSYGNPKLVGLDYEIDYIPLNNIHSIQRRGLKPTIENFLSGTPLTIQSIAYDVANGEVIGEAGMKAIEMRTVAINNPEQAQHRAQLKGKTIEELVIEIAAQFDFTPIL
jgi:hypothetical protein